MALIVPIHGQMSGSIGDNVYSHNKAGPYVRRRAIPVNPTTAKQTAARDNLATLASRWGNVLTANQRIAWASWAALNPYINRLGQPMLISGMAAYCSLNAAVLASAGTIVDDPPTGTGPAGLTTLSAVWTAPATVVVTYTTTPLPAGVKLDVWSTLPDTVGNDPNANQSRLLGYSAAAAASPQTITSPYAGVAGQTANLYIGVQDSAGRQTPRIKVRSLLA